MPTTPTPTPHRSRRSSWPPAHGTLALSDDGSLTYTPAANWSGTDSFTYKATDGELDSNTATVSITVNAVNDAPIATDDTYATDEDVKLTVAKAVGVLANDTDIDSSSLTSVLVAAAHGTLALSDDGSLTYTPAANWSGTDSFTYKATDGELDSNTATVSITVNAVNDAPIATDDTYATDEDVKLTVAKAVGVLANDTDIDSSSLTSVLVAGRPRHARALRRRLSHLHAGGELERHRLVHLQGDRRRARLQHRHGVDHGQRRERRAHRHGRHLRHRRGRQAHRRQGRRGACQRHRHRLLIAHVGPRGRPAHGTLALSDDGSLTYTPAANWSGTDSFTYKATDGELDSNTATVSITVNAVNDAPIATDDTYATDEDVKLTVAKAVGVLANDTDIDSSSLTSVLVAGPAHGTLALSDDGSLTYTPAANWSGTDSFTYKATDGELDSNTATVSITVNAVNDPPIATDDTYATDEDVKLTVAKAVGVLANDTDIDSSSLTSVLVAGPAHGTLALSDDGSLTYTPAANWSGTDSFTYKATDGELDSNTATVSITVNAVNDAPVATDDTYATDEDVKLTVAKAVGVLANDTDIDSSSLTSVLVAGPAHGTLALSDDGSLTYTPAANWSGTDSFTYKATDGELDSNTATVSITVNAVNDAPVATDDTYATDEDVKLTVAKAVGVLANDTDIDSSSLTSVLVAGPAHGTLALSDDGSLTYTPAANWSGTDSFTYKATDGELDSNTATVSITVNAVNDPPVVSATPATQTVQYSDRITTITVSAKDVDSLSMPLVDTGLPLSVAPYQGLTGMLDTGGVWVTKTLTGQITVGSGSYPTTFSVSDGQYQRSATETITVRPENAVVNFAVDNPTAVKVPVIGGASGAFAVAATLSEPIGDTSLGNLALAHVTCDLAPVGGGGAIPGVVSGPDANGKISVSFNNVPVNSYTLEVIVDGSYYSGRGEDALDVYDPSLGFTTGGGWFYWPGTTDRTNFAFNTTYSRNGTNAKGSLLMIRHVKGGGIYRIKSNAMTSLRLGQPTNADGTTWGWVGYDGKATYLEPTWPLALGNYSFTFYAEDRNEPGSGVDKVWIRVVDGSGKTVTAMTMSGSGPTNCVAIGGGNVVVPHSRMTK